MDAHTRHRMTSDEFIDWSIGRPDGRRYELMDGEVFEMASERWYHALVKGRVFRELARAMDEAGLSGDVIPDGMAVQVSADTVYEPDAALRIGPALDRMATRYSDPLLVVEVLSPSTHHLDSGLKLADYFTLPSLQHYLIVRLDTPMVIHHERSADGGIRSSIARAGMLRLASPGIELRVESLFPQAVDGIATADGCSPSRNSCHPGAIPPPGRR